MLYVILTINNELHHTNKQQWFQTFLMPRTPKKFLFALAPLAVHVMIYLRTIL